MWRTACTLAFNIDMHHLTIGQQKQQHIKISGLLLSLGIQHLHNNMKWLTAATIVAVLATSYLERVGGASVSFYASPTGLPINEGTSASPYDIVTAFNISQQYLALNTSVSLFFFSGILSVRILPIIFLSSQQQVHIPSTISSSCAFNTR